MKYPGQKAIPGVLHKIINNIPQHKCYIEAFCGSAAVYRALYEMVHSDDIVYHLNDLNCEATDQLARNNTVIHNRDAISWLSTFSACSTDRFVFLDPPYLHSTRPNSTTLYSFEMTDEQHIQLLTTVLDLKCNIMIIHPGCDLYDRMLAGWRKVQVKIRYNRKTSIEYLYMNYQPGRLQTDAYLGRDCWDRQRIKRKAAALVKKIEALPEQERLYLIGQLNKHLNPG